MTAFEGLSERMKSRRKSLGMTLQQVADICGSSKAYIWEMERGPHANPTITMILRIATALQTTPDRLLGVQFSQPDFTPEEIDLVMSHRRIFKTDTGETG